jgi:hypothetical protein
MSGILQINRGVIDVASLQDGEFYLNKGKNYIQIGSGSSILTLLPLNQYVSGDILLNGNIFANNLTGSAAVSGAFVTTVDIGGIPAGTTIATGTDINTIFSSIFTPFQTAKLNSFIIKYGLDVLDSETHTAVGDSIIFDRTVISSSVDSSGNWITSPQISINGSTSDTTFNISAISTALITQNFSQQSFTRLTTGSVGVSLIGNSNGISVTPITLNYFFNYKKYLVASATNITSNLTAQNAVDNDMVYVSLEDSLNWSLKCNSNNNDTSKYTYILYPASFVDLTKIQQQSTDVFGAFTKLSNYNITSNGVTLSYKIYKSNVPGAFSSGVTLNIQ